MYSDKVAGRVGIATFIMLIFLGGLLAWKSSVALKVKGYELNGKFDYVNGLLVGAEVRYRGLKVGKVFSIEPDAEKIIVSFRIRDDVKVPADSIARVIFDGLIGEKFLVIQPNPNTKRLASPGDMFAGEASSGLSDFIDIGAENLKHSEEILKTLRDVFATEESRRSLANSLKGFEDVMTNLKGFTSDLSDFLTENNLQELVAGLQSVTLSLDSIAKRIEKDILSEDVTRKINTSVDNFVYFSDKLYSFSDKLDRFLFSEDQTHSQSSALNVVRSMSALQFRPGGRLFYSDAEKASYYSLNMDWIIGQSYLRTTYSDSVDNNNQIINIQFGQPLTDKLSTRAGLFYTKPGLGLDISVTDKIIMEMELFNLQQLEMVLNSRIKIKDGLYSLISLKQNPSIMNRYDSLNFGVSYRY